MPGAYIFGFWGCNCFAAIRRWGPDDSTFIFWGCNHFAWMGRQTRAKTPPLTRIAPLDPSYTLPRLTREQRCEWLHRQKDLLHELQHPESYQGPPNWDPRVQSILARDPSTVTERDFIACVELFLEEIVLRVATIQQGILYKYGHVSPNETSDWPRECAQKSQGLHNHTWTMLPGMMGRTSSLFITGRSAFLFRSTWLESGSNIQSGRLRSGHSMIARSWCIYILPTARGSRRLRTRRFVDAHHYAKSWSPLPSGRLRIRHLMGAW